MYAWFEWSSGVIRFSETQEDAEARKPFIGVVSVNRTGPRSAYLFGLHALMSRDMREALVRCLLDLGITQTTDVRHGRWVTRDLLVEVGRTQSRYG